MSIIRPDLGSVAEEIYEVLTPFHKWSGENGGPPSTDSDLGWPLLIFFGTLGGRWQEIEDLIRDSDEGPGWSSIVDIDRCADKGLPYLGQFKGKVMRPQMTAEQMRARIRGTDGVDRGTSESLRVAAKRRLVPTDPDAEPYVIVNERLGGNLWQTGVVTLTDETPDPVGTFNDMLEQKPYGIRLVHDVVDSYGYLVLRVAFDDYGEIRTHYAGTGYEGIRDNDPPAPTV